MRTKGGEFLIKETKASDIFTSRDFSDEQKMMAQSVEDFIDQEVWPNKQKFEQKDYALTLELLKKCGELGILGASIPEKYGGLGMGFTTTMLMCDKVSGATGSLGTAYGAHTGIGILPIFLYGNEDQKLKYLPKMVSGEWIGAYCLTEPGAGSDANSGKTKAVLSDDGKYYSISGQKMWISNAAYADVFIVFARIDDDKNITAFIVEKNSENGIVLGEEEHKLGIRSSSTRQVFFNDTKVPIENMLGERNGGFKIALNALNVGRIKLGVASLDAHRRISKDCVKYAKERIQFKTPIASFGAIQEKLAHMATRYFVADAACYRAAKNIEDAIHELVAQGIEDQQAELKGVEEYATEAAIIKVWASEASQVNSDEAIQIYGGMGFSEETPMESMWRDARITRIYEGTNEINRLLTVSLLLKKAFKGELNLLGPAKEVADELMGIPSFDQPDFSVPFSQEKIVLQNLKKVLLMIAGNSVQTFGMDLESQQELILRIANIGIEIYMAESALLSAEKNIESNPIGLEMAQLNLYLAVKKIQKEGEEAIAFFNEDDTQKAMYMGLKRFTKYLQIPNTIKLQKDIASYVLDNEGRV